MKIIDTDQKSRLVSALAASAILLPAQILAFANYHQFAQSQLLDPSAKMLGYSAAGELPVTDLAYLYGPVFWEFFVLIPAASATVAYLCRCSGRAIAFLVSCSLIIGLVSFTNLLTLADTGNFAAWELLVEIYEWGSADPGIIFDYVSVWSLVEIALFIAAPVVIGAYIKRACGQDRNGTLAVFLAGCAGAIFLSTTALTVSGRFSDAYGEVKIKSFAVLQLQTMFSLNRTAEIHNFPSGLVETIAEFKAWETGYGNALDAGSAPKQVSSSPSPAMRPARNVVFFVMESLPARTITSRRAGGGMPNFERMAARSFVGPHHYATYPYSSDTLFSIFTSLYPNALRRPLLAGRKRLSGIGIFNILESANFMMAVYASEKSMRATDVALFRALGVGRQLSGSDVGEGEQALTRSTRPELPLITDESGRQIPLPEALREKALRDQQAFDQMLRDIRKASASKERFATVFLPQIGHGPWKPWINGEPFLKRGENLAGVHDVWLGELLATLDELQILAETIIVVTSDHGPRTVTEYPEIASWSLDNISFNVPLLIFAPNALESSFVLESASSHIDIMPTVLSLLGLSDKAVCTVGREVWDPGLSARPLFFLGHQYLGKSGIYSKGIFHSYNYLTDYVYRNKSFSFPISSLVTEQFASEAGEFKIALSYQHQLQEALADRILEGQACQSSG